MKKAVEITIMGQKFVVKSESDESYVQRVAVYVNEKANDILNKTKSVSSVSVAMLTAMNIADEFFKYKEKRTQLQEGVVKKMEGMIELIDSNLK